MVVVQEQEKVVVRGIVVVGSSFFFSLFAFEVLSGWNRCWRVCFVVLVMWGM